MTQVAPDFLKDDPYVDSYALIESAFSAQDFWRRVLGVTAPSSAVVVRRGDAQSSRIGDDDPRDIPPEPSGVDFDPDAEFAEFQKMLAGGRARGIGVPLVAATATRT